MIYSSFTYIPDPPAPLLCSGADFRNGASRCIKGSLVRRLRIPSQRSKRKSED